MNNYSMSHHSCKNSNIVMDVAVLCQEYSNIDIARNKIQKAVNEGQNYFSLSWSNYLKYLFIIMDIIAFYFFIYYKFFHFNIANSHFIYSSYKLC